LVTSCAIVSSPRIASKATFALNAAEYRFRFPVIGLVLPSGRTKLIELPGKQGPPLYGHRPGQHLADGGFAKLDDIAALAKAGVETFVPVAVPRDKTRDRHQPRPDDAPEVARWRQRMATEEAKAIYRQRAATAEWVNAQARNHGLTRFLVRGIDKAKAVASWYALAHNMVCTWRLVAV